MPPKRKAIGNKKADASFSKATKTTANATPDSSAQAAKVAATTSKSSKIKFSNANTVRFLALPWRLSLTKVVCLAIRKIILCRA